MKGGGGGDENNEADNDQKAETYAGDYKGGEAFGSVDQTDEWTVYHDDQGAAYWYSSISGESTYEQPANVSGGAGGATNQEGGGGGEAGENASWLTNAAEGEGGVGVEWETYTDDAGANYWYNSATGESTYEQPAGGGGGGEATAGGASQAGEASGGAGAGAKEASVAGGAAAAGGADWQEFFDETGSAYWFNSATEVSQYEKPF